MEALGRQILVEFYECDENVLNNVAQIEAILLEGTRSSGASIISHKFHKFSPHGVSGMVVIAESHVAIHTWPEYSYAAVDIFYLWRNHRPVDYSGASEGKVLIPRTHRQWS